MNAIAKIVLACLAIPLPVLAGDAPGCCPRPSAAERASQDFSDASLFNTASLWENREKKKAPLSQLRGRPQIVAMVYTRCQFACPRIIADLKHIESQLSPDAAGEAEFTLVTIDPERDTVDAFNEYARKQNLDRKRWNFLRGEPADILELAALLGVKYKRLWDGEYSHSNIITLLNAEGEIVAQLEGLGADASDFVRAAETLCARKASP